MQPMKNLILGPWCLWRTENTHSHFCFAKTKTSYFKWGRLTKSHPESQEMFSRVHSQNWQLPSGPTPCCCHQGSLLSSKPCEAILAALPAAQAVSTFPIKEVLFHSRWCIKIPGKVLCDKGIINPSMSAGSEMVTAQISNSRLQIWRQHLLWSSSAIAYWACARHKGKAVEFMKSKELFSINNA